MTAETGTNVRSWGMTHRELAEVWLKPIAHIIEGADGDEILKHIRERLVMCEGLDNARACAVIDRLLAWLDASPGNSIEGKLMTAQQVGADVLTLYVDCRPPVDWPGIARIGKRWTFVLAGGLVLWPAPVEP